MYTFDYTSFAVSGPVGMPFTGLTTPLQLTFLSRSSAVVKSTFWWPFCVVTLLFGVFCLCKGVCHRNESDLCPFLLCMILRDDVDLYHGVNKCRFWQVKHFRHIPYIKQPFVTIVKFKNTILMCKRSSNWSTCNCVHHH